MQRLQPTEELRGEDVALDDDHEEALAPEGIAKLLEDLHAVGPVGDEELDAVVDAQLGDDRDHGPHRGGRDGDQDPPAEAKDELGPAPKEGALAGGRRRAMRRSQRQRTPMTSQMTGVISPSGWL